jgi:hypothetical protein
MGTNYIPSFQALISHAVQTKDWVVIVTPPNSPCADGFRSYGLGLLPLGTKFTGRTALLPDGGKISIVETPHKFDASGPLSVMFLGFEEMNKITPKDEIAIASWRKKAHHTLTLGGKPGELLLH